MKVDWRCSLFRQISAGIPPEIYRTGPSFRQKAGSMVDSESGNWLFRFHFRQKSIILADGNEVHGLKIMKPPVSDRFLANLPSSFKAS